MSIETYFFYQEIRNLFRREKSKDSFTEQGIAGTMESLRKFSMPTCAAEAHGLYMGTVLSQNEREALSRFLLKVISDVEKVSALFESRGADASLTRAAQANLETTLSHLRLDEACESELQVSVPDRF